MNYVKILTHATIACVATLVIALGLGAYVGLAVTSFKVGWSLGHFPNVGTHVPDSN
jgi:hypothetical protein